MSKNGLNRELYMKLFIQMVMLEIHIGAGLVSLHSL